MCMSSPIPALTVAVILILGLTQNGMWAGTGESNADSQSAAAAQKQPCKADAFKKQRDACQRKTGYCGVAYTTGKNKNGKTARAYTGCSSSHADKPATYGKGKVLPNDPYRPSWTECFFSADPSCGSSGASLWGTDAKTKSQNAPAAPSGTTKSAPSVNKGVTIPF